MISAKVICDSIAPKGQRLTTFELRYPRFVHSEFMTHRVISRNASSSRAVPVAKLLQEVRDDNLCAAPVFWGAEQKGMQTGDELTGSNLMGVQAEWRKAALSAAHHVELMMAFGVHKSISNRLLEPFSHINVVASATEWDNFFGLRLDTAAEPTMRALAEAMWAARQDSMPNSLIPGDWHLPYVDGVDIGAAFDVAKLSAQDDAQTKREAEHLCKQISAARCARVSFKSFETGKRSTVEEDIRLYTRLVGKQPLHATPTEHQATPDGQAHYMSLGEGRIGSRTPLISNARHQWGNFVGWIQFRKTLPGESCAPLPRAYTGRD